MPSPLVNRYFVFVSLPDKGKVRRPIAKDPSFMIAVESCLSAYKTTGHIDFVIEDERKSRVFTLDRRSILALLFVKASNRTRYFEMLNRIDRSGDQKTLESALADDVDF